MTAALPAGSGSRPVGPQVEVLPADSALASVSTAKAEWTAEVTRGSGFDIRSPVSSTLGREQAPPPKPPAQPSPRLSAATRAWSSHRRRADGRPGPARLLWSLSGSHLISDRASSPRSPNRRLAAATAPCSDPRSVLLGSRRRHGAPFHKSQRRMSDTLWTALQPSEITPLCNTLDPQVWGRLLLCRLLCIRHRGHPRRRR